MLVKSDIWKDFSGIVLTATRHRDLQYWQMLSTKGKIDYVGTVRNMNLKVFFKMNSSKFAAAIMLGFIWMIPVWERDVKGLMHDPTDLRLRELFEEILGQLNCLFEIKDQLKAYLSSLPSFCFSQLVSFSNIYATLDPCQRRCSLRDSDGSER